MAELDEVMTEFINGKTRTVKPFIVCRVIAIYNKPETGYYFDKPYQIDAIEVQNNGVFTFKYVDTYIDLDINDEISIGFFSTDYSIPVVMGRYPPQEKMSFAVGTGLFGDENTPPVNVVGKWIWTTIYNSPNIYGWKRVE